MTVNIAPGELDLAKILPPGAGIVASHACGEPLTLIEALAAQRANLERPTLFLASSFSGTLKAEYLDHLAVASMGALGTLKALGSGLEIIPCLDSAIPRYIEQGLIGCDVAFVQVSPADDLGRHSYGIIGDFQASAVEKARLVVAEVNAQVPWTDTGDFLETDRIDYRVDTDRPLVEMPVGPIGVEDRAIAALVARYIEDGTTLQTGIGSIPDAVAQLIADRRDLGIHSGMLGDSIGALIRAGIVTNARKPVDAGRSVTGALMGTRPLYDLAADKALVAVRPWDYVKGNVLGRFPKLVSINSAIEVDLTGQVNAEVLSGTYVGANGGQPDFVRAGHRSPGGCSIIALRSTAMRGSLSLICASLSGPVTTPRSDVDVVITEFGAAELRGRTIAERVRRMIAIAHPAFRDALTATAIGTSIT